MKLRLNPRMVRFAQAVTLIGCILISSTGCRSESAPFECQGTIPAVSDEGLDGAFAVWITAQVGPVDYSSNQFWYDGNGVTIGWSAQEDSEICLTGYTNSEVFA